MSKPNKWLPVATIRQYRVHCVTSYAGDVFVIVPAISPDDARAQCESKGAVVIAAPVEHN